MRRAKNRQEWKYLQESSYVQYWTSCGLQSDMSILVQTIQGNEKILRIFSILLEVKSGRLKLIN